MKTGAQKYNLIEHNDLKVRTYGDTGVVNSRVRMTGATNGTPFDNQLLLTHVWVKKDGRWQLVTHQTTRLP
jgi:ketosteroid isomerase-like protein